MEDLLCKAFDEVYEHEFDKYKKGRFHFFSFRHRRMMKELFSRLEKNEPVGSTQEYQYVPKKKRPALLVVAIIFSVLLSITAAAYTIYSFSFKKQHDHTIAFSENIENSPTEIKHIYVIDSLPAGYKESKRNIGVCFANITYKKCDERLVIQQDVKLEYKSNYNTEGYELEKLDVNGCDGFYIEMGDLSILVWDNGDYILSLEGTFTKDELIELAKSVKYLKDIN